MSGLVLHGCGVCGHLALAARRRCPACGADAFGPRTVEGDGTVVSATTVHRAAGPSAIGPAPFTLVLVALAVPCADRVMALARAPLAIGTPVTVRPLADGAARAPYLAEPAA